MVSISPSSNIPVLCPKGPRRASFYITYSLLFSIVQLLYAT